MFNSDDIQFEYCAVCNKTKIDLWGDAFRYIEGLGYVCCENADCASCD